MVAVKLPDIISGSITLENILSTRVLEWLVILVGCKIEGINKLEAREPKEPFSATQEMLKVIKIFIKRTCIYME